MRSSSAHLSAKFGCFSHKKKTVCNKSDYLFLFQVSITGKRRRLAVANINMRKYASLEPSQRPVTVPLDATTHKVVGASIHLTLHCVLLREGQAT